MKLFLTGFLYGLAVCVFAGVVRDLTNPAEVVMSSFGNAALKSTGDGYEVRLGGVNQVRSGAVVFRLKSPANGADSVTLTYRGSGASGEFVLLLSDTKKREWCWNGLRWQGDSGISSAPDFWRKRVFPLKEFKQISGRDVSPLAAGDIREIQLAVGMRLKSPEAERSRFSFRTLALEHGATGEILETKTADPEPESDSLPVADVPSVKPGRTPESAYRLPEWIDWDLSKAVQTNLGVRGTVSLNHYWQFRPVVSSSSRLVLKNNGKQPSMAERAPDSGNWYYLRVPGTWDTQNNCVLRDEKQTEIRALHSYSLSDFSQGWFRRFFRVPADWRDRTVMVNFTAISDTARVFLNGVPLPREIHHAGSVDISNFLHFGEPNEIALLVRYDRFPYDRNHGKYSDFCRRGADWWFGWHDGPGISGDVFLTMHPRAVHADDLRIVTRVSRGELNAGAEIYNKTARECSLTVSGRVLDGSAAVHVMPGKHVKIPPESRLRVDLDSVWKNPVFWSPENPKQYELEWEVRDGSGKRIDVLRDSFGVRELSIRGGDFFLNGHKYRLKFYGSGVPFHKMSEEAIRETMLSIKKMNFNGMIYSLADKRPVKIAGEIGLMLAMRDVLPKMVRNGTYLPGVSNIGWPTSIYLSEKQRTIRREFERAVTGLVRSFRNDPAVVIWAINPLLCYTPDWINPNRIDAPRMLNDLAIASAREETFLRKFDPGRLVIHSMGGNTGSVICANPYPTFSNPVEEWVDWPLLWAKKKSKPLIVEEIAFPYIMNFANYRSFDKKQTLWENLRQMYYEHAARYFGDGVYRSARTPMNDKSWALDSGRTVRTRDGVYFPPDEAALKSKLYIMRECLNAWRMYDISGIWPFEGNYEYFQSARASRPVQYRDMTAFGIKPETSPVPIPESQGAVFRAMASAQQPFLALLGGKLPRFTAREHQFQSGAEIQKSMLFSNDSLSVLNTAAEWRVKGKNGLVAASGTWNGVLEPGAVVKLPIVFRLNRSGDYTLELQASSGALRCRDSFELRVYPELPAPLPVEKVRLYDENGRTEKLLNAMRIPYTKNLREKTSVFVVGALSLTPAFLKAAEKINLENDLRAGTSLLVFPQKEESSMKNYLEERRNRRVFLKSADHPILRGLTARDLRDWNGESDKVEAYPKLDTTPDNRFMRWGTSGTVATCVMDKPDRGRFRVLLDSDADLSRTPLLEYFVGRGRVLFCMLDLEGRYGRDYVPTLLANRIFQYLGKPEPMKTVAVRTSLEDRHASLIRELGFRSDESDSARLLVADAGSRLAPAEVRTFAENGGDVLLLKPSEPLLREFGLNPVRKKLHLGSADTRPELIQGLGNSDFYWNPAVELSVFENDTVLKTVPVGKGSVTVLQILPEDLTQNSATVKSRRILSTLLFRLGMPCDDALCLLPKETPGDCSGRSVPFSVDPENCGLRLGWHLPGFDDSRWKTLKLGSSWESQGVTQINPNFKPSLGTPYDGFAFYRIPVFIPESWKGRPLSFRGGPIDDLDKTYFNGRLIGETTEKTPKYWERVRNYPIPPDAVRWGAVNLLAVRVSDLRYEGGILGPVRITDGTPDKKRYLFFPVPSRLVYRSDPNDWRQW